MTEENIDVIKEQAFNKIGEILMSIETKEVNGIAKTGHILDVLEQLLARVIAGSSISNETIDEMSNESFENVKKLAKVFFFEENQSQK
jgi:hypothetical protein